MLFKFDLQTHSTGHTDITAEITEAVTESGVYEGICVVYCPHTSAYIAVKGEDETLVGNTSETVIISGGRLLLGKHQKIYFCEHSTKEENRKFFVKIM